MQLVPTRGLSSVGWMEVRFRKGKGGRTCGWVALRLPRTVVPGPTMAAGADVPHDLATFVIEAELGLAHGFWGCVAEGATFATLGRRRTPQGRAVIERHRAELEQAETQVNDLFFAWRRGEPTPVDAALDRTLEAWRALPVDGELVEVWVGPDRPRRRRRRG